LGGRSKPRNPPALGAPRQSRGAPRPPDSFTASAGPDGDDALTALGTHVRRFEARFRETVRTWDERLQRRLDAGSRVVVWGAGSKAVTFLNVVPSARGIERVVDINPRKRGAYVAGTGQPIVGPDTLREDRPDTVLVTNPAYVGEVRQALAGLGIVAELVSL
jgi:hypothetical protein